MAQHLSSVLDLDWDPYLGKTDSLVSLSMFGRYPIKVQDFWVPAAEAFGTVLGWTDYEDPTDYVGSYMLRLIAGTDYWSWHSYGGAIDWDYGGDTDGDGDPTIDKNPHLHDPIYPGDSRFEVEFQFSEYQIRAIEGIKTVDGLTVWRWLGWPIGDTMHFEPNVSPTQIGRGIDQNTLIPNYFECKPHQQASWVRAHNKGYINKNTHPLEKVDKGDYWTFQDRQGFLN